MLIFSFHTIMLLFCLIFMILCCFCTYALLLYNLSYFVMTIYVFLHIFDYLFVILILFHVFHAFVINMYILSCMYVCYMSLFDMTPIAVEYHICISAIYLLFFHYYIYLSLNISSLQLCTNHDIYSIINIIPLIIVCYYSSAVVFINCMYMFFYSVMQQVFICSYIWSSKYPLYFVT